MTNSAANTHPKPNTKPDPVAQTRLGENYLTLRQALGLLGFYLPFALLIFYWLDDKEVALRTSISAYYYSGMRDIFVGSLLAIGVFLLCYRGNNGKENQLSNFAGFGAIGVALFPTARRCIPEDNVFFAQDCDANQPDYFIWPEAWEGAISVLHYLSAGLFFAMVGLLAYYVFVETSDTKKLTEDQKALRNKIYKGSALVIGGCIILLGLDFALNNFFGINTDAWKPVFWIEAFAVWAFSVAWLVKGEALESAVKLIR